MYVTYVYVEIYKCIGEKSKLMFMLEYTSEYLIFSGINPFIKYIYMCVYYIYAYMYVQRHLHFCR